MEEQLISFETAKLAKEKGFNISTQEAYINNKLFVNFESSNGNEREYFFDANDFYNDWNNKSLVFDEEGRGCFGCKLDNKKYFLAYSAPKQSLLQKWLREVHNIDVNVLPYNTNKKYYEVVVDKCVTTWSGYDTYEEALEKGLQEALLILK